jgi:acyl-homoserine lactone acylase PvdQ
MLLIMLLPLQSISQQFKAAEVARWKEMAQKVTITRDYWGIPHIYGHSDADAVFGLLYAQCEDDFKRVEMNYIEKLGRLAEVKGSSKVFDDLYIRLVIDSSEAKADYMGSPAWLKKLLNAFADGVNFYLYTHPETRPILLQRFEPWYPLLWTDGSIGAINTGNVTVEELEAFYTGGGSAAARLPTGPAETGAGSNGFAIAPSRTATGNAMLYINPHVTFYFRPEVHVASQEGLNVYGAVTWGTVLCVPGLQ